MEVLSVGPSHLKVSPYNSNTLILSWEDNASYETQYKVERSFDGKRWGRIGSVGTNGESFMDTGLYSGKRYYYRVRAVGETWVSDTAIASGVRALTVSNSKAINISTRGTVGAGSDSIMIAGFILLGDENKDIFNRGIGPSLPLGSGSTLLQDPELVLFSGETQIAQNDNRMDDPKALEIFDTGIPPESEKEAALYANLSPGPYTILLRGANDTQDLATIEVYDVPDTF